METLKVCKTTNIHALAGAIASNLRINDEVLISVIGANCLYQATKAIILARKFLQSDENPSDIILFPKYASQKVASDKYEDQRMITSISLHLKKCEFKEENKLETSNVSNIKNEEN